jgi:hypothetical protein
MTSHSFLSCPEASQRSWGEGAICARLGSRSRHTFSLIDAYDMVEMTFV